MVAAALALTQPVSVFGAEKEGQVTSDMLAAGEETEVSLVETAADTVEADVEIESTEASGEAEAETESTEDSGEAEAEIESTEASVETETTEAAAEADDEITIDSRSTGDTEETSESEASTGSGTVTLSTASSVASAVLSNGADGITAEANEEKGTMAITISKSGSYTICGTGINTYISVDEGLTDVTLTLNGLTIDDSGLSDVLGKDKPVLACGEGSAVSLVLKNSSVFTASETEIEEAKPVIKMASAELTISGSGSLSLTNKLAEGIKGKKGTIRLTSGTVKIVESGNDGLNAKDGTVDISGGTLTIGECCGDGIQAENVNISGGTVDISTVFEDAAGIYYSSSTFSELNYLTETETAGGTTKTERINVDTGSHKGIKAGTKAKTEIYQSVAEEDAEDYTAGVSYSTASSGGLSITGGEIIIDTTGTGLKANAVSTSGYNSCKVGTGAYIIGSPDDGIQSNNTLEISGGVITVSSADDGVSSADSLYIGGNAVLDVETAYEGLEAGTIVIGENGSTSGPTITLNTKDDGINASSKTVTYTYDSSSDTDCNYTKTSVSKGNNTCTIYSGAVTVKIDSANAKTVSLRNGSASSLKSITYTASGDGIDCNGSLDIEGGTVYVFGQSSGDNSPLDHDNGFRLSKNATVLAAGASGMASESIPGYGDAVYVSYGAGNSGQPGGNQPGGSMPFFGMQGGNGGQSSASISAGSVFTVKNGSSAVYSETLPYAASFVLFSSPLLTSGTSYTLYSGSTTLGTVTAKSVGGSELPETTIKVSGIVLSASSAVLTERERLTLTAQVSPSNATVKTLRWTSSDTSVASVSNGTVLALKEGTADITATAADGSGVKAVCSINVKASSDSDNPDDEDEESVQVAMTAVRISNTALTMAVGKSYPLSVTTTPVSATNVETSWESSDSTKVSVDASTGLVKAVSAGRAVIKGTVTSDGNVTKTVRCTVTVKAAGSGAVKSIKLNASSLKLGSSGTFQLTATLNPIAPEDGTLIYSVMDWRDGTECISVDEETGKITAIAAGKAKVQATNPATGKKAVCVVTVGTPVTALTLMQNKTNVTEETALAVNKGITLKAAATGANNLSPLNSAVYWTTSNDSIATVTAAGRVKAVGKGTAVITATAKDGSGVSASCTIRTYYACTKITLSQSKGSLNLSKNETLTLTAVETLSDKSTLDVTSLTDSEDPHYVIWESKNPTVAAVSNGVVTPVSKGTAKILVKNPVTGKQAICTITVKETLN